MPFIKKIEVENGILGIWEIAESASSLLIDFQFSEDEKAEYDKFIIEKRRVEYLATRLLIQKLLTDKSEITHEKSGRPIIINSNQNISISHSAELVVIFISNDSVGIDVENVTRNIDKVTHRFLHHKEMDWAEKSENHQIAKILLWCAKEAIFKCSKQAGVQFDTQIFIPPFEIEKTDCFIGKLICEKGSENFNLRYFYFRNNIIVYCVEVKNNGL